MKVLWFSLTPSCYSKAEGLGYNGGGWIASLEKELKKRKDIELGVAFIKGHRYIKDTENGVTYYVIPIPTKTLKEKLNFYLHYDVNIEVKNYLPFYKKIIDDFKPDIIQIFGSEGVLGFVQCVTKIPCLLHIQGIINPYKNAFFPPGISKKAYIFKSLNPRDVIATYKEVKTWENSSTREKEVFQLIKHYIGRTDWDYTIIRTFNKKAKYYYCSEILRNAFYSANKHECPKHFTIVSTMSGVIYKGLDLILKTAYLLKMYWKVDFSWIIYGGAGNAKFFEEQTGIKATKVNIVFKGIGKEEDICNALCKATAFAQVSYIDNSPNAVCEAQMVGCPVVSTNVGGVASLIEDGKTGLLIPANDPYMMAWKLLQLHKNIELNNYISVNAKSIALERHNKERILQDLLTIYNNIND